MLSDIAFYLAKNGWKVSIITSRTKYGLDDEQYNKYEEINGVKVFRTWSTNFGRSKIIGRFFDYFTFYISAMLQLLLSLSPNCVVITMTDPPLMALLTLPISKLRKSHHINWLQDIFPETALRLKFGNINENYFKLLINLKNQTLRFSTTNIVIGDRMKDHLIKANVNLEKIVKITNWARGDIIKPISSEKNELKKEWNLSDSLVIGYSGNLGMAHSYETLMHTATYFANNEKIKFLFIGGGSGYTKLKKEVEKRNLQNFVFRPYQPNELLAQSLCVSDLHWISLRPCLEGLIVPSKYYGVLAAGRVPIFIGDPDGEIAREIAVNHNGYIFEEGDVQSFVSMIEAWAETKVDVVKAGLLGRTVFEEKHTLLVAANKFIKMLDDIIRC